MKHPSIKLIISIAFIGIVMIASGCAAKPTETVAIQATSTAVEPSGSTTDNVESETQSVTAPTAAETLTSQANVMP